MVLSTRWSGICRGPTRRALRGRGGPAERFTIRDGSARPSGGPTTDGDNSQNPPVDLEDAQDPARLVTRSPYLPAERREVPAATIFEYREFPDILDDDGLPIRVVSPQGRSTIYLDMARISYLGGGGDVRLEGNSGTFSADVKAVCARDAHSLTFGAEFRQSDLEYHWEQVYSVGISTYASYRDYGGEWPTPRPTYTAFFAQERYESEGLVADLGLRLERFNSGQDVYLANSLLDASSGYWWEIYNTLDLGLDLKAGGKIPDPWDIINSDMLDKSESSAYWRLSPRIGISHPVGAGTRFLFTFGRFSTAQKPALLYGIVSRDMRVGPGALAALPNANLRPSLTTAYEVGIEHALPWDVRISAQGYARYSTDQPSAVKVKGDGVSYTTFRNRHFEHVHGVELRLARTGGRFLNGWLSYERQRTQEGLTGEDEIVGEGLAVSPAVPWSRQSDPAGTFRAVVMLSTPREWGAVYGGWTAALVQECRSGGETYYNPDPANIPPRELAEEYWLPVVDYHNTDVTISRTLDLPGGRFVTVAVDIENVWNTKRLADYWLSNRDYTRFVYEQRAEYTRRKAAGRSTTGVHDYSCGDPATFYVFTRPWQTVPDQTAAYEEPISPREDWMLCLHPRFYRLGLRFSL